MTQTRKEDAKAKPPRKKLEKSQKLALEFGPIGLFAATYYFYGMQPAIAVLMVAVLLSVAVTYALTKHVPIMLCVMTGLVLVFGGLSLFLHNDTFFKIKPTILYLLFATALLVSYYLNKPILSEALGGAISLTPQGWRQLTLRMALLCLCLALLNECVWRNLSESSWVTFKLAGVPAIMFLFMLAQAPFLMRHELKTEDPSKDVQQT